jgi:hypothetical protein
MGGIYTGGLRVGSLLQTCRTTACVRRSVNKRPAPSSARGVLCSIGANGCGVVFNVCSADRGEA